MFYRIMRVLVRLAFKVYHRKIHLVDMQNVPAEGALLMTPNHPSAFMEACLLACYQPRSLYFLVRGDVFKNPRYLPFLRGTHQVPIFRARDGFSNLRKNEETFRYCYATLNLGRTVVIFPETGTVWEKKLRPVQRGAARISFGTLEQHPDLDLKIVPVGVNFEDPRKFQSDVVVRFGKAIDMAPYLDRYAGFPQEAIQDVTRRLEKEMAQLVYDLKDDAKEKVFNTAQSIYRNTCDDEHFPIIERDPKRFQDEMKLARLIGAGSDPGFSEKLEAYAEKLERLHLHDRLVSLGEKQSWRLLFSVLFSTPVWLTGYLLTAWPALISKKITRAKMKDQAFVGPIQLALGILLYLFVSLLLGTVLTIALGWAGAGILLFLMSLAYFVARTHQNHVDRWHALFLKVSVRAEMEGLAADRKSIIDHLKQILGNEKISDPV